MKRILFFSFFLPAFGMLFCAEPLRADDEAEKPAANEAVPDAIDLASYLADGEEYFKKTTIFTFLDNDKTHTNRRLFVWTSSSCTDARYPGYRNSPKIKFLSEYPAEIIYRFTKDGKLDAIDVSFFNKGDSKPISETELKELVAKLDGELDSFTGEKGIVSRKKLSSKAVINKNARQAKGLDYSLKWSWSKIKNKFIAEYVNLEISLASSDGRIKSASEENYSVKGAGAGLVKNVERLPDGSITIKNIPMVNQGEKGYCAVAVSERIMRYFGNDNFDQHVFAQMAHSSNNGTVFDDLVGAFKRVSAKAGIKVYEKFVLVEKMKDLDKLISKYNSTAKKAKKVKIKTIDERGPMISVPQIFADVDPDVYRASRVADKSEYKKFLDVVKTSTAKGVPVVWGVMLNVYPEEGLPKGPVGGHLRLITGYNDKEKKLFYSDTWGAGHECKSMDFDTAWAMTIIVIQIEPRK